MRVRSTTRVRDRIPALAAALRRPLCSRGQKLLFVMTMTVCLVRTECKPVLEDDDWDVGWPLEYEDEGRSYHVKTSRPLVILCDENGLQTHRPPNQKGDTFILVRPNANRWGSTTHGPCVQRQTPTAAPVTLRPIIPQVVTKAPSPPTQRPPPPTASPFSDHDGGNLAVWPALGIILRTRPPTTTTAPPPTHYGDYHGQEHYDPISEPNPFSNEMDNVINQLTQQLTTGEEVGGAPLPTPSALHLDSGALPWSRPTVQPPRLPPTPPQNLHHNHDGLSVNYEAPRPPTSHENDKIDAFAPEDDWRPPLPDPPPQSHAETAVDADVTHYYIPVTSRPYTTTPFPVEIEHLHSPSTPPPDTDGEKLVHLVHPHLIYTTPPPPGELEVDCGCDAGLHVTDDIPYPPPDHEHHTPRPVTSHPVNIHQHQNTPIPEIKPPPIKPPISDDDPYLIPTDPPTLGPPANDDHHWIQTEPPTRVPPSDDHPHFITTLEPSTRNPPTTKHLTTKPSRITTVRQPVTLSRKTPRPTPNRPQTPPPAKPPTPAGLFVPYPPPSFGSTFVPSRPNIPNVNDPPYFVSSTTNNRTPPTKRPTRPVYTRPTEVPAFVYYNSTNKPSTAPQKPPSDPFFVTSVVTKTSIVLPTTPASTTKKPTRATTKKPTRPPTRKPYRTPPPTTTARPDNANDDPPVVGTNNVVPPLRPAGTPPPTPAPFRPVTSATILLPPPIPGSSQQTVVQESNPPSPGGLLSKKALWWLFLLSKKALLVFLAVVFFGLAKSKEQTTPAPPIYHYQTVANSIDPDYNNILHIYKDVISSNSHDYTNGNNYYPNTVPNQNPAGNYYQQNGYAQNGYNPASSSNGVGYNSNSYNVANNQYNDVASLLGVTQKYFSHSNSYNSADVMSMLKSADVNDNNQLDYILNLVNSYNKDEKNNYKTNDVASNIFQEVGYG